MFCLPAQCFVVSCQAHFGTRTSGVRSLQKRMVCSSWICMYEHNTHGKRKIVYMFMCTHPWKKGGGLSKPSGTSPAYICGNFILCCVLWLPRLSTFLLRTNIGWKSLGGCHSDIRLKTSRPSLLTHSGRDWSKWLREEVSSLIPSDNVLST